MPETRGHGSCSSAGANPLRKACRGEHAALPDGSQSHSPSAGHDAAGHDGPAPSARPRGPWPTRARAISRHGSLVRLVGDFGDEDLELVRTVLPARQVTRDDDVITVWPAGAWAAVPHEGGLMLLTGQFDSQDIGSIRAAHPDRYLSLDGQTLTIWPATLTVGQKAPGVPS
ncbi:hypothetical protein AB0M39_33595 [Streptomyces sp. NPDC051907]|uniref:hypothetical protein n=1 Tax=Streptomyces sp. NPDC051907 TaxID=3155284 RepID=UPI0034169013